MRKDKEGVRLIDRRRLLHGAGLAIGAAGAASATAVSESVAAPQTREPEHRGYRETEAVKTYYKAARF